MWALAGRLIFRAGGSTRARLLSYSLCIASLPVSRGRAEERADEEGEEIRARAFRLRGGYTVPLVAIGLCLWIAAQSSANAWMLIGGLLAVVLILYWLEYRQTDAG